MIIKADTKGGGYKSFQELYTAIGGKKLITLYNIIVIFTIYGTLIGYQVIISTMIQRVMKNFGVTDTEQYKNWHIIGLSICLVFPVCLLRGVSNLRYATILSIFSISYTTIILIIELPFYWSKGYASLDKIVWYKFNTDFFGAFGITFFAFMSQTGFYAATERLTKRDESHLKTIVRRAITIDLAFYILITMTGYLSTMESTKDLIIDRPSPFDENKPDFPMTISQILICMSLSIGIPMNYVPVRTAIWEQIFENPEYTFPRYFSEIIKFKKVP